MKSRSLSILLFLPFSCLADCNHSVVDRDARLACVTIINTYYRNVVVSGYPGFTLKSGLSEDTMMLPGSFGLVKITPSPYSPYEGELQLNCAFKTKEAKENQIIITYNNDYFEVAPIEFKNNCKLQVVWE